MLRQGLGGHHLAFAFARFLIEDSYEGIHPSSPGLAELPALLSYPLDGSNGLSRTIGNRWQIIFLIVLATS